MLVPCTPQNTRDRKREMERVLHINRAHQRQCTRVKTATEQSYKFFRSTERARITVHDFNKAEELAAPTLTFSSDASWRRNKQVYCVSILFYLVNHPVANKHQLA